MFYHGIAARWARLGVYPIHAKGVIDPTWIEPTSPVKKLGISPRKG